MNPFASFLLLLSSLALLSIASGQDRAPHGIAYENPIAFSPSAYEFFHPKTQEPNTNNNNPCSASNCSPLPIAAEVDASKAVESKVLSPQEKKSGHRVGAGGGIAGIVFGLTFAVLLAMGVFYYVLNTRRANANRPNSFQPDA